MNKKRKKRLKYAIFFAIIGYCVMGIIGANYWSSEESYAAAFGAYGILWGILGAAGGFILGYFIGIFATMGAYPPVEPPPSTEDPWASLRGWK